MWVKLNAKQVWAGHMGNRRKDGTLYEEEATISPVIDSAGNTVNFVAVKRDVTHEVTLEAQNREAARMEAIGLLAGGVAHDFNNQLTILLHCAQMLARALPADHPQQEDVQDILSAVQRSTELTRQLLAFSRKQSIEPVLLDINEAISGSLKMLNRLVGENIRLTFERDEHCGQIYLDPYQLDQILANLTVNARDAISGIGWITIQTSAVTLRDADCLNRVDFVPPGDYVALTFRDTGAGIPEELQSRIFEPFFTTKEVGKGTGLGLATVYGIVKQNSGAIVVRSVPGQGATFTIYLPPPATLPAAKKKPSALASVSGTETILVVEDEPTVLRLVRRSLERRGFRVLEANSPNVALRLSDQYPSVIHLLLTDVIMPEMSGKDLAEQFLLRRPDIRVLFMSGYTSDVMQDQGHLPAGWYVLQKPIVEEVLVAHIRDALGKPAAASAAR
jgi:signal transduction histidine kinase